LSMARATGLGKGLAAGDAALRESMWLQGFASDVNQDAEGQFSGYDASGAGLALGMDTLLDDSVTRIGIAGSYASTSVDGRHASRKDATDIDTLQLSAYMTRDYGDMYIDGMVALAFNDNDASRHVVVGSVDRTASATYDSTLAALRMAAGWKLAQEGGLSITPEVSVTYSHLSSDSYTETGAGNFNLTVNPEDVDMFEGRLGLAIESESKGADGSILRPQFRIGVAHDFAADGAGSTATFAGGGSSFTVTGHERDSTMIDLGAGLTYTTPDRSTDVILNVDGRFADGYDSLGGGLTVRWKF
jgi:outer membrane autotransporter protein